ncbi:unnamed protein product, partial [Meganyctiphanes norvegica]
QSGLCCKRGNMKLLCALSVIAALCGLSRAFPRPYAMPMAYAQPMAYARPYAMPMPIAYAYPDSPYHEPAHRPHFKEELGRVKIQVYRGPNQEKKISHSNGYDKHETSYFAPWGYYVTQPEDKKYGGYHHG